MSILQDRKWKRKYSSDDGNLLKLFYVPALSCAVRYDRTTGFFSSDVLAAASRGVEDLVRNAGHMRLIVGCTLRQEEIDAIGQGESLKNVLDRHMAGELSPLLAKSFSELKRNALELLAWMVARGFLEIRVAIPCDEQRHPTASAELFHEKAGIIEDKTGDRLAFNGSVNETCGGWERNWESFHVYTSWDGIGEHLEAEEQTFSALWNNEARFSLVLGLGEAVKQELLKFMPDGMPKRLLPEPAPADPAPEPEPEPEPVLPVVPPVPDIVDERAKTWAFIRDAPKRENGGELVGEATSAVVPWPHQIHAFNRMYSKWPPRLLIADEVGLGKTVQAGMLLRQAWLSGRARRILVLAPKAVVRQWQIELREKFNLNWPIYEDKKLIWYPSPALQGRNERPVADSEWHRQPFLLASSHLMRRKDRRKQILDEAEPWDVVVLDEAHHARRKGGAGGDAKEFRPNDLLRLMKGIVAQKKTQGLILLTATPMQVDPLEVRDLLELLGLPSEWNEQNFLDFYSLAASESPNAEQLFRMASLCRASRDAFGMPDPVAVERIAGSKVVAGKILRAIDFPAKTKLQKLTFKEKQLATAVMKSMSPTKMLISRHTRELLRSYHRQGKLKSNIADRIVTDVSIDLVGQERELYEDVQDYISTTYDKASQEKRTAIGFVMTIYRRRLASCFEALRRTLAGRLERISADQEKKDAFRLLAIQEEDLPDDDLLDADEAEAVDGEALELEERGAIVRLIDKIQRLPVDSKVQALLNLLKQIRQDGYEQAIIFTQFTDTLDYLRDVMAEEFDAKRILCYSGRQGEAWSAGSWKHLSRDETKHLFRAKEADFLICTDAAAEGLNFQFCGALVNYDMPWNPMRVEQRIGRIDRLGQKYSTIHIYNLLYKDTVETDIYLALKARISMFTTFVGKLQPILSKLPKKMKDIVLTRGDRQEESKNQFVRDLDADIKNSKAQSFDIDDASSSDMDIPERPEPLYDLQYLKGVLENESLRPHDVDVKRLGLDYSYMMPGASKRIRVTTDAKYYEEHSESVELWSPGSPAFPWTEEGGVQ